MALKYQMYLVCAQLHDGDEEASYDLLVIAGNEVEATKLWLEYYRTQPDGTPLNDDEDNCVVKEDSLPNQIFLVPCEELLTQGPRALRWHHDVHEIT